LADTHALLSAFQKQKGATFSQNYEHTKECEGHARVLKQVSAALNAVLEEYRQFDEESLDCLRRSLLDATGGTCNRGDEESVECSLQV